MTRLTTVSTSRASAEQRAGRAGRTEPGAAYRLWSKLEHGTRAKHRTPEILQADLAGLTLELAAWGVGSDPDRPTGDLTFIDEPPTAALRQARELLVDLHAVDAATGALTPLGRDMLALPVHPRLARMVAVERSPLACVVATLIDERDVLRGRPDELPVDLALRVAVISGAAGHDRADRGAVHRLRDRARELARRVGIDFDRQGIDHDRTGAALLLAFPDRLAGRRRPGQFTMRGGSGAFIADTDPLAHEPFVVAADLDGKADRARIRLAAAVDVADVLASAGDDIKEQRTLSWNGDRDDLVETVERRLGAIRLGTQDRRPEPGDATTAALMKRVRETRLAVLGWSAAATRLRERVAFLHRNGRRSVARLVGRRPRRLARRLVGAVPAGRDRSGRSRPARRRNGAAVTAAVARGGRSRSAVSGHARASDRTDRSRSTTPANARRRRSACRTCSGRPSTRPQGACRSDSSCSRRPIARSRSPPTFPASGPAAGRTSRRRWPAGTRNTGGPMIRRLPRPSA